MNFTKKSRLKYTVLASAVALGMAGLPAMAQMTGQSANPTEQTSRSSQKQLRSPMHSKQTVRHVQRELKSKGFYKGRIDGIDGPQTRAALKQYQEKNNLTANGRLDVQTLKSLGVSRTGMRGEAARSVTGYAGTMYSTSIVKQVQTQLNDKGFYTGAVDGISGPETHQAIKRFQQQNNLRTTGRLDKQTMEALKIGGSASAVQPNMPSNEAARSEMGTSGQLSSGVIQQAQSQLQSEGLYSGPVNGVADEQTRSAITQFQQQNGLAVTGRLDTATLEALGITGAEPQGQASRSAEEKPGEAAPGQVAPGKPSQEALPQSIVSAAQRALKSKGFYKGPVNGIMNPETRTAITNYQQQSNLPANGQLTPQTAASLGIAHPQSHPKR